MSKGREPGKDTRGGSPPRKRTCIIDPKCLEDLQYWAKTDARVLRKVLGLIEDSLREPFEGLGKPEPMKYLGPNSWSRRITQEHRLVYVVSDDRVYFAQARMHY